MKTLECPDCGSRDYPYHEECCTMGDIAEWKMIKC